MGNYSPTYPTNVIKQITIGSDTFALKDDTLRALIAGMNSDITENTLLNAISGEATDASKLVTNAGVKSYVDSQVGSLHSFSYEVVASLPTASADTMYIIYLVAESGTLSDVYTEYITIDNGEGASPRYTFERIGTTETDLSSYLKQTATVAGVSFGTGSAISAADLSAAMDLKALAHKDSATGVVASQTISDASATIALIAAGDVVVEAAVSGDVGSIQLSGSVSKPDVSVATTSTSITPITTVGTSASFTQGSKAQWSASVENETLSFTWAANGDDTFTANELPTQGTAVNAIIGVTAELSAAPEFTGDYIKASFSGTEVSASTTIDAFTVPSQTVTVS